MFLCTINIYALTVIFIDVAHPENMTIGKGVSLRSTSDYSIFLDDNLLSWCSKRQTTVSRSKAEYKGVANVIAKVCWIRNLLLELGCPPKRTSPLHCDNVSAIYILGNPIKHQNTKHLEINIHFVRESSTWLHKGACPIT